MNPQVPGVDEELDDAGLERLLRQDAARDAYVEDAGFSARVMAALPPPRRQRSYSWLGPALGTVAVAGVAGFSPLTADLVVQLKNALSGNLAPLQTLLLVSSLAAATYFTAWFAATNSD